jgi:hypothetical protein
MPSLVIPAKAGMTKQGSPIKHPRKKARRRGRPDSCSPRVQKRVETPTMNALLAVSCTPLTYWYNGSW